MKPYPRYKPFPEVWLPRIPSSWSMRKIKYLFRDRSEKGFPNEPLLAATQNHGVIPKTDYENRTVEAQKDLHLLKLVRVGDFVISLRSFQGGIEYAYHQGIISPAYTIMVPLGNILPGYFRHLAKSGPFLDLLKLCVTGIREGQNIDYERLKKHFIPLPPPDVQTRIVQYLDEKTAAIDELVRAKERQIELLRERKQALVSAAVTRGLGPTTRLNDSGVSWIGKIPAHWEVVKFKRIANVCANLVNPDDYSDCQQIAPECIEKDSGCLIQTRTVREAGVMSGNHLFRKGQILYSKIRPTLNKVIIAPSDGLCSADMYPIETKQDTKWLLYFMLSAPFVEQVREFCARVKMPKINKEDLGQILVFLPPLPEQRRIVAHLDSVCADFASTGTAIRKQIALLQELRTRLVSDAVTGAVEVP